MDHVLAVGYDGQMGVTDTTQLVPHDPQLIRFVEALYALSRVLRYSAESQADLQTATGTEIDVLHFVAMHPNCSVSAIARGLNMQTSNVSTVVKQLASRSMIVRTPDNTDRRSSRVQLTPAAEAYRAQLAKFAAQTLVQALQHMATDDRATMISAFPALNRLAVVLST